MASDALVSEWADSFLSRLTAANRQRWEELVPDFIRSPISEDTVDLVEEPGTMASPVGDFLVTFRFLNAEVIEIASITWGPDHPASQPDARGRL